MDMDNIWLKIGNGNSKLLPFYVQDKSWTPTKPERSGREMTDKLKSQLAQTISAHHAANQKDIFAQYWLGVMYMEGQGVPVNFDLAKEHFQKLVEALKWDKEFYPYDVKQWVFLLAQEKLRAIEEKAANKQMLSFLTHTLINSLGNVPGTVREIIKRLGSDYEHKTKVIDKIVS
jgi:hypothetical protein